MFSFNLLLCCILFLHLLWHFLMNFLKKDDCDCNCLAKQYGCSMTWAVLCWNHIYEFTIFHAFLQVYMLNYPIGRVFNIEFSLLLVFILFYFVLIFFTPLSIFGLTHYSYLLIVNLGYFCSIVCPMYGRCRVTVEIMQWNSVLLLVYFVFFTGVFSWRQTM